MRDRTFAFSAHELIDQIEMLTCLFFNSLAYKSKTETV